MNSDLPDDPDRDFASPPCMAGALDPVFAAIDPWSAAQVARWRRAERDRLRADRLALPAEDRAVMARALARHLDAWLEAQVGDACGRVISGYWPIKGEFDLRFWLEGLYRRGALIALPVVETRSTPLAFRRWQPGMAMERGDWNIPVPPASADRLVPEVALAPLVGWDAQGYRLGYGGGYFDRTLAALSPRPVVIGVGLQSARLATIHPQGHDIPMSAIVTEVGVQVREEPHCPDKAAKGRARAIVDPL